MYMLYLHDVILHYAIKARTFTLFSPFAYIILMPNPNILYRVQDAFNNLKRATALSHTRYVVQFHVMELTAE